MFGEITDKTFDCFSKTKKKIFVVEGPDGTGKTTVANILSQIYDIPVIHLTWFDNQIDLDYQFEMVFNFLYSLPTSSLLGVVFDRFTLSNKIYSKVCENALISHWVKDIEKLIGLLSNHCEITYVQCFPKNNITKYTESYKKLFESREELLGNDVELVRKVYDAYDEQFRIERAWYKEAHPNIRVVNFDMFDEGNNRIEMKEKILKK